MIPFLADKPFTLVFLFLMCGVALRSTTTFWIGRYGHYLVAHQREPKNGVARRAWIAIHASSTQNAVDKLNQRGWPLVTLCFFTVGVQTAVILAAGLLGMRGWRFIAAALPGWLGWATIYSTIGFAAWAAIIGTTMRSPWGAAGIALLVAAGIAYIVYRRRRLAVPAQEEITA